MAKIFNSRIIMLTIATILIIALIVACVLVSIKPKSEYKGVLEVDEVIKTDNVLYSLETEKQFRGDVGDFLEKMLESFFVRFEIDGEKVDFDVEIKNASIIANPLLSIFSKAAIPSDKLLNFSSYLKGLNTDDAVVEIWLFLIKIEEDPNGEGYVARFSTPAELAEIFTGKVNLTYAINEMVANTALTAEEAGRLLYELVYYFADVEQQEVLASIGRASFVSIFVSITTIYEAYAEFSLVGGTLTEARMLGELAYETGAKLDELIESHGVQTLLTALWLNSDNVVDDSKLKDFIGSINNPGGDSNVSGEVDTSNLADIQAVNNALKQGINVAEFAIYFARTTLMEVGNAPFEHLANFYANESDNSEYYLYLHQITLARAIASGIDDALEKGSDITEKEDLIEKLANFKLTVEEVEAPIDDHATRVNEIKAYLREYFDTIYALSNEFEGVIDVEDVANLNAEERNKLIGYSTTLTDINYNELMIGADSLASTLLINITFNIMSQVMEDALGSVVS